MKIKLITAILTTILLINNSNAQNLPLSLPNPPKDMVITAPQPEFPTVPPAQNAIGLQFNDITLANLLKVVFSEVIQSNYVLSTKVITDERPVSFRFNKNKDGKIENFLSQFLKSMGYSMIMKNGVYYIEEPPKKTAIDFDYFVYVPKYRTANYLADLVNPYFPENFIANNREVNTPTRTPEGTGENLPETNAINMGNRKTDILTFKYDDLKLKKKIISFLNQVDTEEKNIIIKAYVYEVSYTDSDGSAIGLMANLASKKFNIQLGPTDSLNNFVKLSSNALSIFVSNLNDDSRVKLISNQQFRVKNGEEASFKAGQKIPTLGSVSYQGDSGTPVQNIEKVDTGSIIKATPKIKKNIIDIDFYQEISEAFVTTTGVNNSPTIQQRNLKTSFSTKLNEVVMLAGLTQIKKNNTVSQPFLLPWFKSNNKQDSKTDIVIFLEVLPSTTTEIPEEITEEIDTK